MVISATDQIEQKQAQSSSIRQIALQLYEKPPFNAKKPNEFLTKLWKPWYERFKRLFNLNIHIPTFSIGQYSFTLGDVVIAVIICLIAYLLARVIIALILSRMALKSTDLELLEQKTVEDFIALYTEHRVNLKNNEALRYLFLAFIKTIMSNGYKQTSNYQLYLYCSKLFPYHKKELREFIKLFEDSKYGVYECSSSDLDLAHFHFIKLSEQFSYLSSCDHTASAVL